MFSAGEHLTAIGPNGRRHSALVVTTYQSTGGITSIWIDLGEDFLANPANWENARWRTRVLVLTERAGRYVDLWGEEWRFEAAADVETPGTNHRDSSASSHP